MSGGQSWFSNINHYITEENGIISYLTLIILFIKGNNALQEHAHAGGPAVLRRVRSAVQGHVHLRQA